MKRWIYCNMLIISAACGTNEPAKIDREALVNRNNPIITEFDALSSLSVGNGEFAFTVDATGLQSFPELCVAGVPLGTQSQWGWHKFPDPEGYKFEETLENYNFRGREEPYSVQFKEPGRKQQAADWYRVNPHRLHLGNIGMELLRADGSKAEAAELKNIRQELKLREGVIQSRFEMDNVPVEVQTVCHPKKDAIAADIKSALIKDGRLKLNFRFAYPTGQHSDDACNWSVPDKHSATIVKQSEQGVTFERRLDAAVYYVTVQWTGKATITEKEKLYFVLSPENADFSFVCSFTEKPDPDPLPAFESVSAESSAYWQEFWKRGGAIDFSACKAKEAAELERRVVLSQYLMAIQCAGTVPPQETGLTYNSWYGKFHLEMHWWHAVHFALWNRIDLLERSMDWYNAAYPVAKSIAERQGFEGIRWMKMTDPSALEAPSGVGSFLIWQQPHFIYMAELIYRNNPAPAVLDKYKRLVDETARFMASFATYEKDADRYVLKGLIPAQETLRPAETVNPPFELSYWHYALGVAQQWRERTGQKHDPHWDEIIAKLSPLAAKDGLYLAAESAPETYSNVRFTSDHPAVLGALGIFPQCRLVQPETMQNTLRWIWDRWNWNHTWGWDYPMTAMSAARLGEPEKAVGALLMDKRTNTYLANGHNYQNDRLRIYLPGNGGLLTAVAMMCAGWDGCTTETPGFPKDGNWDVRWEGLAKMP